MQGSGDLQPKWPDRPSGVDDNRQAQYTAAIAVEQARLEEAEKAVLAEKAGNTAAARDMRQSEVETDLGLYTKFHEELMEVAKGAIDRARAGAQTIQTAAATIVTLYTAALALAFSVADRPLPTRALFPGVFLGLAMVLSTVYLAYLSPPKDLKSPDPHSDWRVATVRRLVFFIKWVRAGAMNKRYWLHASIVALAIAVAWLPAPFESGGKSSADAADAARNAVAWPPAPDKIDGAVADTQNTLFSAQVSEAASLRKAAAARARDGEVKKWWWLGLVGSLVLVFALPALTSRGAPSEEDFPAPMAEPAGT
jgi:hypothetical protein